jgi:hypothetical protein
MIQEAVILRFPGSPNDVAGRYAEGIRRFGVEHPATRPVSIFTGRSEADPDALVVVLVWPEGVSHEALGHFMLGCIRELGLQRPAAEHLSVDRVGWEAVAAVIS